MDISGSEGLKVNEQKDIPAGKDKLPKTECVIEAATDGKEVWLASTLSPLSYYLSLAHEVGHTMAGKLSFREDVLTPDEVKALAPRISPRLADELIALVTKSQPDAAGNEILKYVALQCLGFYTKGKFDENSINLHENTDPKDIADFVLRNGGQLSTGEMTQQGTFVTASTKEGRNDELPAIACEKACSTLLENALKQHYPDFRITTLPEKAGREASSHDRAARIVNRAYAGQGWTLPSSKDMAGKTE